MTTRNWTALIVGLGAAVVGGRVAFADDAGSWYVDPMIQYHLQDNDPRLKDDFGFQVGLGMNLPRNWAVEGDFDLKDFKSNLFAIEWPPRSGRMREFPEADRADWLAPQDAMRKIVKGQIPIIAALSGRLRPGAA